MISLTPRAAEQVRTLRSGTPDAAENLRLSVENGGCSGMQYGMSFDQAKEGDVRLQSEGIAIVIDPEGAPEEKIVLAAQGCPTQAIAIFKDGEKVV